MLKEEKPGEKGRVALCEEVGAAEQVVPRLVFHTAVGGF